MHGMVKSYPETETNCDLNLDLNTCIHGTDAPGGEPPGYQPPQATSTNTNIQALLKHLQWYSVTVFKYHRSNSRVLFSRRARILVNNLSTLEMKLM